MTISVAGAKRLIVPQTVAATGTVMPWQELTIDAQTSGLSVVEVGVRENDTVRAGDVLVRFDSRALKAQIAQQKAAVTEAQATLDSARQEAARGDALVAQKAMSLETVETRRTAIRTSQAKLDQAAAALDQLQVQIDQTVVRAPTAGVVSLDPVKLGTVPQAGTELVRMSRDGRLEVQARVPERDLGAIRPDQVATVVRPDGRAVEGHVRDVAAKVDAATRLGVVYVQLAPNAGLRIGMFANVAITIGQADRLTIPEQALVWPNGKSAAFVVAPDGGVRLAPLATGSRQDGRIVVEAGLQDGDCVAVTGAGFLHDGDRVRVGPTHSAQDGGNRFQ